MNGNPRHAENDLIASRATAAGAGAVAIVRLDGQGAKEALEKMFLPAGGRGGPVANPRRMVFGKWPDAAGETIDEGLAVFFPGPHSYSGNDLAEFHCHGGAIPARRLIEANIVQTFLKSATRKDVKRLQEHVAREEEAWRGNDRRAILKLSGEFHLKLAEAADNTILLEMLRDLISRSSLIIAVYQSPGASPCPPDAHRELTAMLERRQRAAGPQ